VGRHRSCDPALDNQCWSPLPPVGPVRTSVRIGGLAGGDNRYRVVVRRIPSVALGLDEPVTLVERRMLAPDGVLTVPRADLADGAALTILVTPDVSDALLTGSSGLPDRSGP
jgi:hypothetical protein